MKTEIRALVCLITICIAIVTNGATITVTSGEDSGAGTLRQAILDASSNDTIDFSGVSLVTLTNEIADVGQNGLIIDGGGTVSITTEGASRALLIDRGDIQWTLNGLTFTNCSTTSASGGGAIYLYRDAKLTANNCTFVDCTAPAGQGGAVSANRNVDQAYTNSTFINCSALGNGGAIGCTSSYDLKVRLVDSTFINCSSLANGGAVNVYWYQGNYFLYVENSTFDSCSAVGHAGAIYASSQISSFELLDSTFTNCISGNQAGAIFYDSQLGITSRVDNCSFVDNQSKERGGALVVGGTGYLTISDTSFIGNESTNSTGGAIMQGGVDNLTLEYCIFKENEAIDGGAISFQLDYTLLNGCLFDGNIALRDGGAISAQSAGITDVANSTFVNNRAGIYGGAIYASGINVPGESFKIYNSTFTTNYCAGTRYGGITFSYNATNTAVYSSISYGNYTEGTTAGQDFSSPTIENIENCLIGDPTGWSAITETNNITATDPLLGTLADNGGPTLTIAISKNSPARDAGTNPLGLLYDQRGLGSPRENPEGATDIGAFEYMATGTIIFVL